MRIRKTAIAFECFQRRYDSLVFRRSHLISTFRVSVVPIEFLSSLTRFSSRYHRRRRNSRPPSRSSSGSRIVSAAATASPYCSAAARRSTSSLSKITNRACNTCVL